jgi:nucleotide-binding universal stress UspA family protein
MSAPVIAVGFDGSADARAAAIWAANLAARLGDDVVLVRARGLLDRFDGDDLERELAGACAALADEGELPLERISGRVVDGDPLDVLLGVAEEPLFARLLVVGTRGLGEHSGMLLGSTSLQLAERATIPLVVVPIGV